MAPLPPPHPPDDRAAPRRAGLLGVVDVGSTKIACLIGRAGADGALRVTGFGWQRAHGVRAGGIVDPEAAEKAIRRAVGEAEDMAELRLRQVFCNLSCGHPESRLFQLQWPVGGRVVTSLDLRRLLIEAGSQARGEGREAIHMLPLGFAVDGLEGIADPRGLHCDRMAAKLHAVHAGSSAIRNLAATIGRCDLELRALVAAPIAAGLAVLAEDERELGATVIDLGGGCTGIAAFAGGNPIYTAQLPMGGMHVTADIARGLSTTLAAAERLKTLYGHTEICPDDERELLPAPVAGEDDDQYRRIPRAQLVSIIRPRLEEIFETARDRLQGAGLARAGGSVVIAGGGGQLVGASALLGRILGREVRVGRVHGVGGLPERAEAPAFATAAGLLIWAAGGRPLDDLEIIANPGRNPFRRLLNFLKERV